MADKERPKRLENLLAGIVSPLINPTSRRERRELMGEFGHQEGRVAWYDFGHAVSCASLSAVFGVGLYHAVAKDNPQLLIISGGALATTYAGSAIYEVVNRWRNRSTD